MARHARPSEVGHTAAQRRKQERAEKARQRRLAEREQISGEIRTPDAITARRAKRADKPSPSSGQNSRKTPVSARTMVPERTFSGRMIVLTIVTLVVISFLVPTVRSYLQQRAELNELSDQIAAEEQRQDELYSDLARWDDPEYVKQQARERINLVLPGERRYHVIGDLSEAEVTTDSAEETAPEQDEWTDQLWDSVVESADE